MFRLDVMNSKIARIIWFAYAFLLTLGHVASFVEESLSTASLLLLVDSVAVVGFWTFVLGKRFGPGLLWKAVFIYEAAELLYGLGILATLVGNATPLLLGTYFFMLPFMYGLWRISFGAPSSKEMRNKSLNQDAGKPDSG